jgi:hypothetical protein
VIFHQAYIKLLDSAMSYGIALDSFIVRVIVAQIRAHDDKIKLVEI